jgi:hypothetical protein
MKVSAKNVEVIEVENEGLISLLDKKVYVKCMSWDYVGTLIGVNDNFIKVENASIVYNTEDDLTKKNWSGSRSWG